MNIAIFTDTYFPTVNGVASSILTLANGLMANNNKVYIFSISKPAKKIKLVSTNPTVFEVPSISVPFLKPYRAAKPVYISLLELCKKFKINIIHSQTEFTMGTMSQIIAKTMGIPHIHTYHTMWEDYSHYLTRKLTLADKPMKSVIRKLSASFCNKSNALIVPTAKVKRLVQSYGANVRTYIIPSGIDFTPFQTQNIDFDKVEAIKKSLGITPSNKVLLSLGRIAKEKGIHLIIKELPKIIIKHPEVILVVVGDGPELDNLRKLTQTLNISKHVLFPGLALYEQRALYYRIGDIFVSCSTSETQGLTYYEALVSGLPVVAKYDSSITDLLQDDYNSKTFKNPNKFPEIVNSIFENEDYFNLLVSNASLSVSKFTMNVFAKKIEETYAETINIFNNKRNSNCSSSKFKHVKYKTHDQLSKTMTLVYKDTHKIVKPLKRKTYHAKRKIKHLYGALKSND